ncbi:hypothetical protein [Nocardia araoensis]|uniref:hypothetical protein n=1 Tax=Nocardia araoensis TaxID=228600 RepID=UPI0012F6765B|nr:hypothetical protein [Nocardia araoensis]
MSAFSNFFTQPGFWIGTPVGTVLGGWGGALINARASKASDLRKAAQEDKTNREKREHEEKIEREKRAYEACTELYTLVSEVMLNAIDVRGTFNLVRDAFYTAAGLDDPKVDEKIAFAATQTEDLVRIGKVYNKVKFNAPKEIVGHATELYQSISAVARSTTEPMAKAATLQVAGSQLDTFINAYRTHYGLEPYSLDDAKRDTAKYLETLKEQVDSFIEEYNQQVRRG